jgi:predicted nucleic acid-binding protein
VIILDTSALVDSLTGARESAEQLRAFINSGERVMLPTLVLYEWLRGPRRAEDIRAQEGLFPAREAIPFGVEEAIVSAKLYSSMKRPRSREVDLAIASCALVHNASIWTLNRADFEDVPGLRLVGPTTV